jgi:hypothetical protein
MMMAERRAIDRVVIDWNSAVQFKPSGQQKLADNDLHLVIKPDSWIVTYLLMVLMVDATGTVLPAGRPMDPADRVQGEVSYSPLPRRKYPADDGF